MTDFCIECGAEADWVRSTQFAGDHHAYLESDFNESDSYLYWYKIVKDDL